MKKVVVITGTASGIGKAAVEKFTAENWDVVATVRKEADLKVHGGNRSVRTLVLDVDDEVGAVSFAARATEQFGRVDALVNNAGYYQMGPLEGSTMEQIHRQYQTNVFAVLALVKAFTPQFRAQHGGVFVNIASITGEQGYPYNSVYASSKAALATLSESLSIELAEFGITVRAIMPGQHATRIFTKIDAGSETPDAYQQGIADFFAHNAPTGSEPAVTADVIYRATVDPDPERVRYYSGPDSVFIPRAKQVLGPEGYWREFRQFVAGRPSALWKALVPAPGTTPVDFKL